MGAWATYARTVTQVITPPAACEIDQRIVHRDLADGLRESEIWSGGELCETFTYPSLDSPAFASPMLNEINLHLCGGWGITDTEGHPLDRGAVAYERMLSGLKPLGERAFGRFASGGRVLEDDEIRDVAETAALMAEARGAVAYLFPIAHPNSPWGLRLCFPGALGELFDLDALAADYRRYLADSREAAEEALAVIDTLRDLRLEDFLHGWRAASPLAIGLVLGYPVWSSASILRAECGPDIGIR